MWATPLRPEVTVAIDNKEINPDANPEMQFRRLPEHRNKCWAEKAPGLDGNGSDVLFCTASRSDHIEDVKGGVVGAFHKAMTSLWGKDMTILFRHGKS